MYPSAAPDSASILRESGFGRTRPAATAHAVSASGTGRSGAAESRAELPVHRRRPQRAMIAVPQMTVCPQTVNGDQAGSLTYTAVPQITVVPQMTVCAQT